MSFKANPSSGPAPWRFVPVAVPEWDEPSEPPRWLVLDRHSARRFEVRRAAAEEAARCLGSLHGDCFGLDLAEDPVYAVQCGRHAWMLLFDRCLLDRDASARLASHPATPALVASRSEQTGAYSISYLVRSAPAGAVGDLRLSVFRTTGRLAFAGTARMAGDGIGFSVHAVSRPGAFAIELAGRFAAHGLVIDSALSSPGVVVPKRQPIAE